MQNQKTYPLPADLKPAFEELATALRGVAGERWLGLVAFGGALVDDPAFAGLPARSVAIFESFELKDVMKLAAAGTRLGQRGLAAPLLMTPAYIKASGDVFPLELVEIQHVRAVIAGPDCFAELVIDPRDLRLQCERELRGQLIQLRQGLLGAAGGTAPLGTLCNAAALCAARVLRGVACLAGWSPAPRVGELMQQVAQRDHLKLEALTSSLHQRGGADFNHFEDAYRELLALAEYLDRYVTRAGVLV